MEFYLEQVRFVLDSNHCLPYGRANARLKTAQFPFDAHSRITAIGFPHFSRFGVPRDLAIKLEQITAT